MMMQKLCAGCIRRGFAACMVCALSAGTAEDALMPKSVMRDFYADVSATSLDLSELFDPDAPVPWPARERPKLRQAETQVSITASLELYTKLKPI